VTYEYRTNFTFYLYTVLQMTILSDQTAACFTAVHIGDVTVTQFLFSDVTTALTTDRDGEQSPVL